jgi:hypothetical protein
MSGGNDAPTDKGDMTMATMKLNKKDEKNLTNQFMSMYAVYSRNRSYRLALETLESIMMFATNEKTIAEITPTIEWLRKMV